MLSRRELLDIAVKMVFITVRFADNASASISCVSNSPTSFSIAWGKISNEDSYVITWYSVSEYHEILGHDVRDFRDVVRQQHEENLNRYYGFDYEEAFDDTGEAIDLNSFGYVTKSSTDIKHVEVTSGVRPNNTYSIVVRATNRRNPRNATLLNCEITTQVREETTMMISTTKENPLPPSSSGSDLDPIVLYVIIPGTILTLVSVLLLGILINRKWRKRFFRSKTPVRPISRESEDSQITVSMKYSADDSCSSSSNDSFWQRRNRVGTTSGNLKKRRRSRNELYRHYVVTPSETFIPSYSPDIRPPTPEEDPESLHEDDPFDRLHHRHSLTTVTEESDSDDVKREGRYARFSARTFDSRLTSRECSFITYKSRTPGSRSNHGSRSSQQREWMHDFQHHSLAQRHRDTWSAWSSRIEDTYGEKFPTTCWFSDEETEHSIRENALYSTHREDKYSNRHTRKRPLIERRQRRVVPSVTHVQPLIYPSNEVIRSTEEGARLLGLSMPTERRGDRRNSTPAKSVVRKATPGVEPRLGFAYKSPHSRVQPQKQLSTLRSTKSSRNLLQP